MAKSKKKPYVPTVKITTVKELQVIAEQKRAVGMKTKTGRYMAQPATSFLKLTSDKEVKARGLFYWKMDKLFQEDKPTKVEPIEVPLVYKMEKEVSSKGVAKSATVSGKSKEGFLNPSEASTLLRLARRFKN